MATPKQEPDIIQLHQDTYDVYVDKSKLVSDFSEEYQERMALFYRFYGYRYESSNPICAPLSVYTLDLM